MGYTVLARKYRSQTFDDVIGQSAIAQTLKNSIKTGRVAHAYLFTGTRGVGKTTMARILSKALNCQSSDAPTAEPCCECESCLAINKGDDIDVIEIDGASNNKVEEVRELRENSIYRPSRSRYKIYIIDEVHMLSTSAFNALLKTLEEPPEHVKFIFATTEPNKVIDTIQSRCQRFDFRNISTTDIGGHLKQILEWEGIEYAQDLIPPLAKMANGSMRDGLSLLDRLISTGESPLTGETLEEFLGCPDREKVFELVKSVADSDPSGALKGLDGLLKGGLSGVQVIDSIIDCMRDLMICKADGGDSEMLILTGKQKEQVTSLAEQFDIPAIVYNITALEKNRWAVKNSEMYRALLESIVLRLTLSEDFIGIENLISQVSGGAGVKKNAEVTKPAKSAPESRKHGTKSTPKPAAPAETFAELNSVEDLASNWDGILGSLSTQLNNGTAGLLKTAQPVKFENGALKLGFDQRGRVYKKMCEGKKQEIEKGFSTVLERNVRLEFELIDQMKSPGGQADAKGESEKEKEVLKDPAVREIIAEFGAQITKVDCK
jgi:DNA polymerase-3 subunit gamma/tau